MVTLALDTALDHAQAALVGADGTILGASMAPAKGDAEAIVAHADAALAAAGCAMADITRVAVTVGPGSFTGVRVGIAYAKGLAFALKIPAAGVTTLEVIARQAAGADGGRVVAAVDARHGAVFAGLFGDGVLEGEMGRMPVAAAREMAAAAAADLAGPASAVAALGGRLVVERLDPAILAAAAAAPGERGLRAAYLAAVDAAPQRHKALARA
ncbi:tRNA (adenosine(37)-N6)-threonylcarbamoyltransferase complex dimerization subunit type 1 TsaB [Acuticoccus mangrovi]|uniref:tRNA (Adenosine(37)-N6)-threonylcarbamoyltransferase complex dimerization subunit type 1 TsaB n=1 Tax=Acuticoccus mangrovi TaxID=2796142 RepID=A0A934IR72_9HYPH|nr:tRNA (adenosine(37)-N6)-threonylcarbamoyltransferase complex dimerization subunit type 1 TsaB [Acuticoccus mangrovi]MBJ3777231.1 tRNA (adenosine(37)-N6)-threonylcarbamoyltransferase complex dimerization subunit type 1 TsaB [Acuticoccus mangrovi]